MSMDKNEFENLKTKLFHFYKQRIEQELGHLDLEGLKVFEDLKAFAQALDTEEILILSKIFSEGFRRKFSERKSNTPPQ